MSSCCSLFNLFICLLDLTFSFAVFKWNKYIDLLIYNMSYVVYLIFCRDSAEYTLIFFSKKN